MAGGYTQTFTLAEIFNAKELRGLLPLVNYKEREDEQGKTHRTTNLRSVGRVVYDNSVAAARRSYEPLVAHKLGNLITLGGNLVENQDDCVEAVYQRLLGAQTLLEFTANNADMIRAAVKEGERNHDAPKLWLREKSIAQVKAALQTRRGKLQFMNDIMQNLYYGNYPQTQKKFGVSDIDIGNHHSYEENKLRWERKVGEI